ncbi:MAG TPA: hypothetical protein VF789_07035 [Thermoanaerobaculia bacterium]
MARTARKGRRGIRVAVLLWLAALPAVAGQIELVSRVAPRRASDSASGESGSPALSADGRYAVFVSEAVNLVSGQIDRNRANDVFLYDRITDTVTLVSRTAGSPVTTGDRASESPQISADGRWVVFLSAARNLVAGQQDAAVLIDVFLWDRVTGTTTLVSRSRRSPKIPGNMESRQPALSADGRWVAFTSFASDLVERQVDAGFPHPDVFLFDRVAGRTTLVSRTAAFQRRTGDGSSETPSISADGRYVAFRSRARNLTSVPVSAESEWNAFVYDRAADRNSLVSRNGMTRGESPVRISANGEYVAFVGPFLPQLFLVHRATGRTTLVSHARVAPGRPATGDVRDFALSADASWVAFTSSGYDLVAGQTPPSGPPTYATFLFERATRENRRLHAEELGGERAGSALGGISADGRWTVFTAGGNSAVQPDAFLYDRSSGEAERLTSDSDQGFSWESVISTDGQWVAFSSTERGLAPGKKDFNRGQDVFLYGRATGERELASRRGMPSATPQATSLHSSFSADGRYAVYISDAPNLVPGVRDANDNFDVFLYDQALKSTTLVSRSAASPLQAGNGGSWAGLISADGRFIAFFSQASDLVPGQIDSPTSPILVGLDVFLYDRVTGQTTLVSHAAGSLLTAINGRDQGSLDIAPDGSLVLFGIAANGLVPGQETSFNPATNVFVYERASGAVTLVSHAAGSPAEPADAHVAGQLSDDGRFVLLNSPATNLPGAPPASTDPLGQPLRSIYLFDRASGGLTRVAAGVASGFSADGRYIVFYSYAEGFRPDVFLYDRVTGASRPVSQGGASALPASLSADGRWIAFTDGDERIQEGNVRLFDRVTGEVRLVAQDAFLPAISPNGRWVAFLSYDEIADVYLWDRTTGATVRITAGDDTSYTLPAVTDDGRVLFSSRASNLVPADFNLESFAQPMFDVFLYVP